MGDWERVEVEGKRRKAGHCVCGLRLVQRGEELRLPVGGGTGRAAFPASFELSPTPVRTNDTPWGRIQHVEQIAAGVDVVVTGSHCGLRLSAEVQDRLPSDVLCTFMNGPGWAERIARR